MARDAQPLPRSPTRATAAAKPRGLDPRARRPVRAAVRRRFDEAALAAAIRELSTHRHPRVGSG